jgi:hypothetical protein
MKKTKNKARAKKARAKVVPAPTSDQLASYIGKRGTWVVPIKPIDKAEPFTILVEVVDARWLFGRLEFRIRPYVTMSDDTGGSGETWAQGVVLP